MRIILSTMLAFLKSKELFHCGVEDLKCCHFRFLCYPIRKSSCLLWMQDSDLSAFLPKSLSKFIKSGLVPTFTVFRFLKTNNSSKKSATRTYFPRFRDFNFDLISENVGLIKGSLSQHVCIKWMMPLLSPISLGRSGRKGGIRRFLTWSITSTNAKRIIKLCKSKWSLL